MAFPYTSVPDYLGRRYDIIRYLEESRGVVSLPVYTDSYGIATIGAGFLVWEHVSVILNKMGIEDPTGAVAQAIRGALTVGDYHRKRYRTGKGTGHLSEAKRLIFLETDFHSSGAAGRRGWS